MNNSSYVYKMPEGVTTRIEDIARISELLATCKNTRKRKALQAELKAMIPQEKRGRPLKKGDNL